MKKILIGVVVIGLVFSFLAKPKEEAEPDTHQMLSFEVKQFLESKKSPLAPHTELLLQQKHWKLLIAISAIESQYCKRKIGWNCWGIGGDSAYRKYPNIEAAIVDANALIESWQSKGKWLTPEEMNCSYVVPCNQNWVNVVNKVSKELSQYESSTLIIHQQERKSRNQMARDNRGHARK